MERFRRGFFMSWGVKELGDDQVTSANQVRHFSVFLKIIPPQFWQ
jgi:hypothetical protein